MIIWDVFTLQLKIDIINNVLYIVECFFTF